MQLFNSILAVLSCLIAFAAATGTVQFGKWPTDAQVGKPQTLTWTGGDPNAPVTITLQEGPPTNLKDVKVLTSDGKGGSYTWTPDISLPEASDYAFKISQNGKVNYSGQIKISGGSAPTTLNMQNKAMATATGTATQSATSTQMSSMVTSTLSATKANGPNAAATDSTAATSSSKAFAAASSSLIQSVSASASSKMGIASQPSSTGNAMGGPIPTAGTSSLEIPSYWVIALLGYLVYNL